MTYYPAETVRQGAVVAYRASMAGDNDDYVYGKADLFVERCRRYDGDPEEDEISLDAVNEIAFAALDPYCTGQLYHYLDSQTR